MLGNSWFGKQLGPARLEQWLKQQLKARDTGQAITPDGQRMPIQSEPSHPQQPMRMQGGSGSNLNPSVARFIENPQAIENLGTNYYEGLEQNPALAKLFNKIRGRYQTAVQQRATANATGNKKSLEEANKVIREEAGNAARLEKKLVEKGIVRNGIHYRPEPELLGNNKHGLEWDGGPTRLQKPDKSNVQGKFGSLADIQFAVEKGAEIGVGKNKSFDLPNGSSSIVYVYKDGIVGGEIITIPAKKVFVLVRPNGLVHAYPAP